MKYYVSGQATRHHGALNQLMLELDRLASAVYLQG